MYPNYDTVTGNPQGLLYYQLGTEAYDKLPAILNSNFNEGLTSAEIESEALVNSILNDEYIAADEFGGDRRSLSAAGLDQDFLGNNLLRRSLGFLSSEDNMDLEDFAEGTTGNTKNNFLKVMRGKTDEVLKGLKDKEKDGDFELYSYFAPVFDEESGEYRLKEVVGTKEALAKVELAGTSVINSYGPKKFTGNAFASFTKGFADGIHGVYTSILAAGASATDLVQSAKGEDTYGTLNALHDYRSLEQRMDTMYGSTTIKEDQGAFDNLEGFGRALGNGISSTYGYAMVGVPLTAALAIGGVPAGIATGIGAAAAGLILNGGEAYQAAKEAGLSDRDSAAVMMVVGTLNTVLERAFGSNKLINWLVRGKSGETAAKAVVNMVGGDISKLSNRGIRNQVLNNLVNMVDRVTANTGFIGTAFEEGAEEFMQNQIKSSIEVLYDNFVAPPDVEVGQGRFGTELFTKESMKSALEEGAIGAIIGAFGGFVHSKTKEDSSIVPYIASGEYESLLAGMNAALQKGAITQEQYDGIKQRADALKNIYDTDRNLFAQVAQYSDKDQMEISEGLLKNLRDQDEYIQNTQNGEQDNYQQFVNLLKNSSQIVTTKGRTAQINTADRFERELRNAGRKQEADIIRNSRKDAENKIDRILPKPKKFNSEEERRAWLQARQGIQQTVYELNADRQIGRLRRTKLTGELNSILAANEELNNAVNEHFSNERYVSTLTEKYNAIRNASTNEELSNAVKDAEDFIRKSSVAFELNNPQITNIRDYSTKRFQRDFLNIQEIASAKMLRDLTLDKSKSKGIVDALVEQEKQRSALLNIQKQIEEANKKTKSIKDYYDSDEYKTFLDATINDENASQEDKNLFQRAKDGETAAQIEIAERQRKQLVDEINSIPISDKAGREEIRNRIDDKNAEIRYLQDKKRREDIEFDRQAFKRDENLEKLIEEKEIKDNAGNAFKISYAYRSEANGLRVQVTPVKKDGSAVIHDIDGERLHDYTIEVDGKEQTLAEYLTKVDSTLQAPSGQIDLTGNSETEYETTTGGVGNQISSVDEDAFSNNIRLAAGEKFNRIINSPSTDVSKMPIVFTISENIDSQPGYPEQKKAKQKYLEMLNSNDPVASFENMPDEEKQHFIKYLPIQGVITYRGYKNIVYTFDNASKEKELLILSLLRNDGKVELATGHVTRTPGYLNYQRQTSNTLTNGLGLRLNKDGRYVFPNGAPFIIGIADATNAVHYFNPSENSEYLLVANATGTPGAPYLIIPGEYQLTGEEGYVARLNPSKIPLDIATVIARIFSDISLKRIRLSDAIPDNNSYGIKPSESGYLTYGQFLNNLIYFGENTKDSKREPDKILYIDYSNNGVIRYGRRQEALDPNDDASIAKFADWMSKNKNFSLSRANLNNDASIEHGFTIKSGDTTITFKTGEKYLNAIVNNNFLHTDLDIKQGLISKSYLVINKIPATTPSTLTEDNVNTDPVQTDSKVEELPKEIDLTASQLTTERLQSLPDGTVIVAKVPGGQKHANTVGLIKKGNKLVTVDNKEAIYINDENIDRKVRETLVKEYNKKIDAIVAYENDHPESMQTAKEDGSTVTVSSIGLKISTMKFEGRGPNAAYVDDPDYYKKVKKVKLVYPAKVKPSVESKQKPTKAKITTVTNNGFTLSMQNPFATLEPTEEVKRLSALYDKLLENLSKAPSKEIYISNIEMLAKNPINLGFATADEIRELMEYVLPDGNSVYNILKNFGKVVQIKKQDNFTAPSKTTTSTKKQETAKTELTSVDQVTLETSPFKLGPISTDPQAYAALIDRYRNEYDQLDNDGMRALLGEFNALISDVLPEYEIFMDIRKHTLRLRKRKTPITPKATETTEVPQETTPAATSSESAITVDETSVNAPMTTEELIKAAGVTPEETGMSRRKPKGKFGSFNKKSSVPMQVTDNGKRTSDLEKELKVYRGMLNKVSGGNVKFVDHLIRIIGESGRPGWAWSIMNEDGITLYEQPAEGAIYHEAFHRVSLLLLSNENRNKLYKTARKEYSLYNRSDNEVEEFLAERFREYVLDSNIKPKGFIGRLLSNMKNFIISFLRLNRAKVDNIDGFFKSIRDGRYKYATVNKAALTSFNQRYANADAPLTVNGVTLHKIYNSALLGNIVNALTSMTLDINGIQRINDLERGLSFNEVMENLIELRDKYLSASENPAFDEITKANYKSKVELYDEIINNFNTVFRPLIDTKLQGYNIRKIENDLDDKDDLNSLVNDEIRSAYEFSVKDNAQADIRVMFLTLKNSDQYDPETFLPSYVNPDIAWYNTFSAVHNAHSIDEMLEILLKKADETSTIRQAKGESSTINMYSELYDILTRTDEDGNQDEMLKTRFWNTFKKHRNNFLNAYFSHDVNEKNKAMDSYTIQFGDADVNKRSIRLERNWSSLFGVNGTFSDKRTLQAAIDDFKALATKSRTRDFLRSNYTDNAMELVRILNSIDIAVDLDTIGILLNKYYFDSNLNKALKSLLNGVPKTGRKDPVGLAQFFGEKGILQQLVNDEIDDVAEKALDLLSTEKSTIELARAYVDANPTAEDDSVLGPDGNLVYAYSENNTITSMFEEWLKDDDFFNQLNGVTYNRSSLWLAQMKDPKVRENVHVDTMLSLIDLDDADAGRGYLDIAANEDLILKFNAVLNDKLPLPTLANKRTFYFITGLKRLEVHIQNGRLNKEVIDVFVNYAINEYLTIQEAIKAKNNFLSRVGVSEDRWNGMSKAEQEALMKEKNTNYKDLVENYHYVMKGGMKLIGNGYNFRYFSSLQNKLSKPDFFDPNNQKLRNIISDALNQQVNNTIKLFINQKIIVGNDKYDDSELIKEESNNSINTKIITRNRLLPNSIIKSKSTERIDLAEAIADYAINSAISTYEFEKLVSGDVAYYKGGRTYQAMLDDRVKRYSALTSTKSILREDWPKDYLDFNTHKYRTSIFSSNIVVSKVMYDEMMSKYVGTDDNHGLLWKQFEMFRQNHIGRFDGMSDEELKQEVLKEADKRLSGYLETDQTDAQVLISPKMFRKLAIMNGEWNQEKEEAYNLMESDEPLTLEQELQAYTVVMQPLKYIHFGYDFLNGLQIPIYDKMSLSTVFKRVAKGRDLQKVYDFMAENDVDMVKFDTAVKSGLRQKGTFYIDGKPNEALNDIPVYEQSFKYLGKQLVTDPHHVSRISMGTQMVKIGVAGVEDEAIYDHNGTKYTGAQLISDYVNAIGRLSDIGKSRVFEEFGISEVIENGKSYLTLDKDKFVQMLKQDAISSNLPFNLIDVLKTIENNEGNKEYYIELSGIPALAWIQSRIISMIKKETIDVNTPGGALIQMSNFAYKDSFVEVDASKYEYKFNKELRFKDKDNRLEAIVSINLFKDVLPKDYLIQQARKNNTTYFEEARKFILSNPDLASLSYRIPTQGMNSTLPITVVDVLPSNVGDTIVLPAELTKLTGADFDVDKMYIARYNYDVVGGELVKVEFIDDVEEVTEDGEVITLSEEDYLRKVYNYNYRYFDTDFYKQAKVEIPRVLSSVVAMINRNGGFTDESLEILRSLRQKYSMFIGQRKFDSIINDTNLEPTKRVVKLASNFRLEDRKKTFEEFYEENKGKTKWELNDSRQIENKLLDIFQVILTSDNHYMDATVPLDFATDALKSAVKVVDSFSNLNKDYADTEPLFPLYQESVKTQNIGADKGIGPMALINTFRVIMQIAKLNLDRGIKLRFKRGKTEIKRNLVALLPNINNLYDKFDANGVSIMDWTSALINAHVDAAKDSYITRLNVNSYTYDVVGFLTSAGVGINQFYFLPQPILKEIADEAMRRQSSKMGISKKERMQLDWRDGIVSKYIKQAKLGKDFFEDLDEGSLTIEWRGENYFAQDLVLNEEWLVEQLSNHYNRTMDSNWYRNQVIIFEYFRDIQDYSKALSNLVLASRVDTGKMGKNEAELILSLHSVERIMEDKHFLNVDDVYNKTFLSKKLNNSSGLLFDLLKNEMLEFTTGFRNMVDLFGRLSNTYYDRNTRNINQYMSELKFAMQAEFFNEYCKQNNISLRELFYGDNTIVDRVNKVRNQALSGTKYIDLADNMLLKMLIPSVNREGAPKRFETVLKLRDTDAKNSYTYAWRDLLEHRNKEIRDIARDLIIYSFYTSGGRGTGIYATLDLVPYEVLGNMSYNKDGIDYTYNQFLKELMLKANLNMLDYNKYIDYAFRASMRNRDIVQEPVTRNKSYIVERQENAEGKTIYMTVENDKYTTTDDTPVPFLQLDGDLYKLIGFKGGDPLYALTYHVNYRDRGFTINEGTDSTFINDSSDYTDLHEPFSKKFVNDEPVSLLSNTFDNTELNKVEDSDNVDTSDKNITNDGNIIQKTSEISKVGYKKGLPQKTPDIDYVFTENAEVYTYVHNLRDEYNFPNPNNPKINVSDVNGTNQAGIRTDKSGNITPNAYGIVVKKYQQNSDGKFVAREGQFQDTNEDFEMFTRLNEDMFSKLAASSNRRIVFPSQMALGKAALPLRFAEWLQFELQIRFNVESTIERNINSNYDGYGLRITDARTTNVEFLEASNQYGTTNAELLDELANKGKERKNECK